MPDEAAQVHAEFVEKTWRAVALVSLLALVGLPVRSLASGRSIDLTLVLSMSMPLGFFLCYLWRHRLPRLLWERLPLALVLLASAAATVLMGLQGNGIVFFVMANVLAAMLLPRRLVKWVLAGSLLWVTLAAAGYVNGWLPVRLKPQYATNPVVWLYAILTVALLAYVVVMGISDHQESLKRLMREVMAQREEIARLAHHDALTGLPSLRLARDRLDMACSQATRSSTRAAALFVDLDDFKAVNDSLGHEAGDVVLQAVSARLQHHVRSVDTVARLGGDEFLVVLNGIESRAAAERVAHKLREAVIQPITVKGPDALQQVRVGASIGLALYPDDACTPETLLALADQAMYSVKRAGKTNPGV